MLLHYCYSPECYMYYTVRESRPTRQNYEWVISIDKILQNALMVSIDTKCFLARCFYKDV